MHFFSIWKKISRQTSYF